jgi:SSS family solute:Na+ symporter
VPAAIMSIAAANLFTRNVYKEYLHKDASPAEEARVSRLASLVVKAGAVVVILVLDPQFSIDLQLIGGVIIVQTLPAIVIGLYSRVLHAWGLLAGWALGLASGMYMLYDTPNATTGKAHFGGPQYALSNFGIDTKVTLYTGLIAIAVNLLVAILVTAVVRAMRRAPELEDRTMPEDYEVEAGDPGVRDIPEEPAEAGAVPASRT